MSNQEAVDSTLARTQQRSDKATWISHDIAPFLTRRCDNRRGRDSTTATGPFSNISYFDESLYPLSQPLQFCILVMAQSIICYGLKLDGGTRSRVRADPVRFVPGARAPRANVASSGVQSGCVEALAGCPAEDCVVGGRRTGKRLVLSAALVLATTQSLRANIDLEWRPIAVGATLNEIIEIDLYAVSDTGFTQSFSGISALFNWDPTHLELLGFIEPCTQEPCPSNTYDWLQSWFPDDSELEDINGSLLDGDAFFQVLGRLGLEELPLATPNGLHITTLRFRVLTFESSVIDFIPQVGVSKTRVAGGDLPGVDVTGILGPPVQVLSRACDAPVTTGQGGRYLFVTPAAGTNPVALVVNGNGADPTVSCVRQFVQPDGSLGASPVYRSPATWATTLVFGEAIRPSTTYRVQSDCAMESPGLLTSDAATATTWRWGDTNNNGALSFTDVSRVIDAASGIFPPGIPEQVFDLAPCTPDGVVNQADVDAAFDALALNPFPCASPCVTTDLTQLLDFVSCLSGPGVLADPLCTEFDFDQDGDVDATDFGTFTRRFVGSGG